MFVTIDIISSNGEDRRRKISKITSVKNDDEVGLSGTKKFQYHSVSTI
jgi:hypothetical protein